jgi:PAS domain S-box-containing protein
VASSYVDEMVKLKKTFSFDNIGYNSNNSTFWFRTTVHPITGPDNEIKGRYYFFEDVTALKNSENAFKESQELWKFALEGAGEGVWSFNVQTEQLTCSGKFKELLGYDKQDKFDAGLLKNSLYADEKGMMAESLSKNTDHDHPAFSYETRIKTKQGKYNYYQVRGKIIEWGPANKPLLLFGTLTDINDEKLKDIEFRSNAKRLATLIENFNSAILLEGEDRNILLVSKQFISMFGIPMTPEQMIGMNCESMARESKGFFTDPDAFEERINRILEHKELVTGDKLVTIYGQVLSRDFIPVFIDNKYCGHLWKYT